MPRPQETLTVHLELRDEDLQEGKATILLAPYGETTQAAGHPIGERFLGGAFRKSVRERMKSRAGLKLFLHHDHKRGAIGRATELRDTEEGPVGTFQLALGDEDADWAWGKMRAGLLDSASVGFRSIRERVGADGAREILEGALGEVSLVPIGAYEGAGVLSLRDAQEAAPDLSWVKLPPVPTVNVDAPIRIWVP